MATSTPTSTLPPAPTGPSVWEADTYKKDITWIYALTQKDIEEIDRAVEGFNRYRQGEGEGERGGVGLDAVNSSVFVLENLGATLRNIQNDIVNGRGFVLIRGLPVEKYSKEDQAIIFLGIGSYFGDTVSQNAKGHILGHVRDLGSDPKNPLTRIYTTNERQRFHTDSCDIVGLLCLKAAKSGGLSSLCSSESVYKQMLERRPDLLAELVKPLYWDRKGEIPAGKLGYWTQPIFNFYGGYLSTMYDRNFYTTLARFEEVPKLTTTQIEALDFFEELVGSDLLRLDMTLVPGDMQFIHNHQILHARTSFEDFVEEDKKRHLLRLWLSTPNGRPLPPVFAERYGNIELGTKRGGIIVPGAKLYAPLDPFA